MVTLSAFSTDRIWLADRPAACIAVGVQPVREGTKLVARAGLALRRGGMRFRIG